MELSDYMIKFFLCNNECWMYDAYNNKILQLSKDAYCDLKRMLNEPEHSSKYITSLKRKDYFKEDIIKSLENPYTKYADKIVHRNLKSLTLQVTQSCNFRCRYCSYAFNSTSSRYHNNKKMSWDIAKKSLDYAIENSPDSSELNIAFYGGEPLLCFNLIKKCVQYAKERIVNKKVVFSMTTNFYSLTDEMIWFIVENNFRILISLDGPEEIQNNHRRLSSDGSGTFNQVIDNIIKLKLFQPIFFENNVQFNPVVFYDEDPNKILDFFKTQLGVAQSNIQLQRVDETGLAISYDTPTLTDKELNEGIFNAPVISHYKKVLRNRNKISSNYHINGSCVPGADKLFVSTDGTFYPCEKANECNECMQIGSLNSGINIDKIKYLMNIGYMNQKKCKKCWAIRFCKICCVNCDDGESKLSQELMENKCKDTRLYVLKYLKKCIKENSI